MWSIIVAALDKLDPRQRLAQEVLEMEGIRGFLNLF
jgi:hypothetical protein